MKSSAQIIRDEIEEGLGESETSMIVSIEFSKAFMMGDDQFKTYREIYHAILTHEYSRETELEVVRVIIDNNTTIVGMERVFKS